MINRKAFIVGIKSTSLSKKEIIFLKKHKPWGVILFSRNVKGFEQIKKLIKDIRFIFKDKNYPILIDQEGGRVNRLNKLIETSILTAEFFGNLYKKNKKKFFNYYKIYINQISYLLNEIGANINTVPVLDVRRSKSSNVIGDRSYSSLSKNVSKIGDFCIKEFKKNGIGTVIKHIPGHGLAKVDSHKLTPVVKKKMKYLYKNDFAPFKSKKTFFAMTAHVIYKDIDPINTATHSAKIIKLIRKKIGFKNIIISDDISMKGLKYSIKQNLNKALSAGCNLILHCNANYSEMITVAENTPIVDNFIIKKTSQFYKFLS
jgi:beta-N-acetylhexosaminidase